MKTAKLITVLTIASFAGFIWSGGENVWCLVGAFIGSYLLIDQWIHSFPPAKTVQVPAEEPTEPATQEVVHYHETRVVHEHYHVNHVTEATEQTHSLRDGTTVTTRHIKRWQ